MCGILNFNDNSLQVGALGKCDLQVGRNNHYLLRIDKLVIEGENSATLWTVKSVDADEQNRTETAWPVRARPKISAEEAVPGSGVVQDVSNPRPLAVEDPIKASIEVIRRIHMRLGHASRIAIHRALGNAKLVNDKEDVGRVLSNCGFDAGLHQARQVSLVTPHRSQFVGHAIQVYMFYPTEYPA